jgi:DNA-binding transcriptional ArsR family regulator
MQTFTNTFSRRTPTSQRSAPAAQWIKQLEALADSTRLRITAALLSKRLNLYELARELRASREDVLIHLCILRDAGIVAVEATRGARHYSVTDTFQPQTSKIMVSVLARSGSVSLTRAVQRLEGRAAESGRSVNENELSRANVSCTHHSPPTVRQ